MNVRTTFCQKISIDSINPDSIIIYSISLFMGVMFFDHTNALATILYFTAMSAWVYKWIRARKVLLEWDVLGIILLVLLINAFLSSIFSYDVRYSFREFRGEIAKMVGFYFLLRSNIKTARDLKTILRMTFAGALAMSLIGVVGYFTGYTMYWGRTVSLFANQSFTSLGFYLLITCCLLLGQIIHEKDRKKIIIYLLLVFANFSCILVTLTRSIWLGFFSALAISFFFCRKRLLLLFPVIILVFFLLFPTKVSNRFMTIFDFKNYAILGGGGVLSERVQLWESAAHMIRDYPVLGVGYGKRIFKRVYIKENYIVPEAVERIPKPNAHNLYLDIPIQLGIPGLIIFLFWIAVFFKETISAYKSTEDYFLKGILWGCLLGVYELLQIGLTGNLFYDENGLYIIFLMAIAMVFRREVCGSQNLNCPSSKLIRLPEP